LVLASQYPYPHTLLRVSPFFSGNHPTQDGSLGPVLIHVVCFLAWRLMQEWLKAEGAKGWSFGRHVWSWGRAQPVWEWSRHRQKWNWEMGMRKPDPREVVWALICRDIAWKHSPKVHVLTACFSAMVLLGSGRTLKRWGLDGGS
jgi:hypothetical protein